MMYYPFALLVFLVISVEFSLSLSSGGPDIVTAWTLTTLQNSTLLDSLLDRRGLVTAVNENELSISLNFNGIKASFANVDVQRRGGTNAQDSEPEATPIHFIVPGVEGLLRCYLVQSKLFHEDLAAAFPQLITKQGHCEDGRSVHLSFHTEHPDSFSAYFTVPGSLDFIYVDNFQKETNVYLLYFKGERKRKLSQYKKNTEEFQCGVKGNEASIHVEEQKTPYDENEKNNHNDGKFLRRRRLEGYCNNVHSMTLVSTASPVQYQHINNQNLDRLTESMFCAIKATRFGSLAKTIKFTAGLSTSATYGFSTCPLSPGFNSVMQIRSGSCDGPILACNDDATSSLRCSQISLALDPGDVVYIQIAASNSPSSMPTSWSFTVQSGTNSPTPVPTTLPPFQSVVFRLAIVATLQYSIWAGSSDALILNKIGTTVARINGIYTRELGIFLQLIGKTNQLFCGGNRNKCNSLPDYFAQQIVNNVGTFMTSRGVQATEYDIAHVFSTGAGGLAAVASLCTAGKARGVSGLPNPSGDSFSVDFVAHELGHQLGGEHSYRNCDSGPEDPFVVKGSAVEPGSGSTIMAYAGICNYNIQTFSDPYFHPFSISQIRQVIDRVVANGCGQVISNPSRERVQIDSVGLPSVCRVPIGNYFRLRAGSARVTQDPSVVEWYQWDRVDPIAESYVAWYNGSFRSWVPTKRNSRFFPNLYYLTFGWWNQDPYRGWERLPSIPTSWMMRYVIRSHFLQTASNPNYDASAFGDVAMYDVPLIFINTTGPLRFSQETREFLIQTVVQADLEVNFTWDPSSTTTLTSTVEILMAENTLQESATFDYDRDTKELDWISLGKVPNNGQATLFVPWPGPDVYFEPKEVNWMIRSADSDECSFFDYIPRGNIVLYPTAAPSHAPSPPTTWSPSTSPTTSKPSTSPTTSKPSSSPTTSNPTTSPTAAPSNSPTTSKPSQSPTTSIPSMSPTTSRPTQSPSFSPTKAPTPPTLRPTQPPYIEYCLPNPLERNAKNCNSKKALCAVHGINLKWGGAGCGRKKKRKNDGGCQCAGYCGYKCKKACKKDKECVWKGKKKKAKCYSKRTNLVGQPIARCA